MAPERSKQYSTRIGPGSSRPAYSTTWGVAGRLRQPEGNRPAPCVVAARRAAAEARAAGGAGLSTVGTRGAKTAGGRPGEPAAEAPARHTPARAARPGRARLGTPPPLPPLGT